MLASLFWLKSLLDFSEYSSWLVSLLPTWPRWLGSLGCKPTFWSSRVKASLKCEFFLFLCIYAHLVSSLSSLGLFGTTSVDLLRPLLFVLRQFVIDVIFFRNSRQWRWI